MIIFISNKEKILVSVWILKYIDGQNVLSLILYKVLFLKLSCNVLMVLF